MKKTKSSTIEVQGTAITILSVKEGDYISLTDMLKAKDGDFFISDWLRNRNTVEFLGIWETVHNPGFNYGEFAIIKTDRVEAHLQAGGLRAISRWLSEARATPPDVRQNTNRIPAGCQP